MLVCWFVDYSTHTFTSKRVPLIFNPRCPELGWTFSSPGVFLFHLEIRRSCLLNYIECSRRVYKNCSRFNGSALGVCQRKPPIDGDFSLVFNTIHWVAFNIWWICYWKISDLARSRQWENGRTEDGGFVCMCRSYLSSCVIVMLLTAIVTVFGLY